MIELYISGTKFGNPEKMKKKVLQQKKNEFYEWDIM